MHKNPWHGVQTHNEEGAKDKETGGGAQTNGLAGKQVKQRLHCLYNAR